MKKARFIKQPRQTSFQKWEKFLKRTAYKCGLKLPKWQPCSVSMVIKYEKLSAEAIEEFKTKWREEMERVGFRFSENHVSIDLGVVAPAIADADKYEVQISLSDQQQQEMDMLSAAHDIDHADL